MPPWIDVPQAPGATRARARARNEARPGYEIRNAASSDEAELLIYDEIDSWWGVSAGDVISALANVTAPNLRVRVNSPGGSVFEGLAIANALRSHPSNVTVQVDGLAASIASVIAVAGDRLVMMPQSMMMIHEAAGVCFGDATDMQQMADVLSKISDNIAGAYASKAGGTAEDWRTTMRAETWYLPEDAVAAGLADEAVAAKPAAEPVEPDGDEPAMHAQFDLALYGYAGPKVPEKPKPGPPKAKAEAPAEEPAVPVTLTISLGEAVGEQLAAAVRAAVQQPADVPAAPAGTGQDGTKPPVPESPPAAPEPAAPTAELRGEPVPDVAAAAPTAEPEPVAPDPWAAAVARLIAPEPTPWAAAVNRLISSNSSSRATES